MTSYMSYMGYSASMVFDAGDKIIVGRVLGSIKGSRFGAGTTLNIR